MVEVPRSSKYTHGVEVLRTRDLKSAVAGVRYGTENRLAHLPLRDMAHLRDEVEPQVTRLTLVVALLLLLPALVGLAPALRFSRRWRFADAQLREVNAALADRVENAPPTSANRRRASGRCSSIPPMR